MTLRRLGASGLLLLCTLLPLRAFAQYTVHTLLENGPQEERITVLLLSEGYTEAELPVFMDDAQKVMSDLFAATPFKEYQAYFNVLAVAVPSNESGADHPAEGLFRDTYFQVTYSEGRGERIMSITWPDGSDRLYALQTALGLGWWNAITILLVNDPKYGASAGGAAIIARGSIFPEFSFEAAVHEMGHAFGALDDEYEEDGVSPVRGGHNLTSETQLDAVPWRHWIEADTPLPTPMQELFVQRVGLFEGGGYALSGVYRPQAYCKMRSSADPFCAVCQERLVAAMHTESNMLRLRATSPVEDVVAVTAGEAARFELRAPLPEHGLRMSWRVDGVEVAGDVLSLEVDAAALGQGEHTVELVVADETPMVRDPELRPLLTTTRSWRLEVRPSTAVEGDLPAQVFLLAQNYPNPVRESTVFTFHLPSPSRASLRIYDLLGREVATVADDVFPAGQHQVTWSPEGWAAGLYVYSLEGAGQRLTRSLVVAR